MSAASQARDLADRLLLHVLQDEELLSSLLGRSGMDPSQLTAVVNGPEIHEFILEFVTESDDRVLACAEAVGIDPAQISMASRILSRRD
ncbi:DUF3572 family protein [Paracoccus sp. S1E-3]|uniref:DUF3572 family protein n=1 Tax=Paracoccus sp. S1E-3 TaxID=2756130 RepID=UPI0015EFA2D9|nr:DUF3572 family protein [Paracoccus sp. S1E-3]MBA4489771.1 DUF3572 family protein [Paracoccus sp. S1E-3]